MAALTAGAASVPTPITEQESENWLYWRAFSCKAPFPFSAGADPAGNRSADIEFEVDSKAMRKFPAEMGIYSIIETVEAGTATINFQFDSRVLTKQM